MDAYRSRVAGQIHDFNVGQYVEGAYAERVDRYAQFAMVATKEAVANSGLRLDRENPHRIGTIVGAGMGGMVIAEREQNWMIYSLPKKRDAELTKNLKCLQDCVQTNPVFKRDLKKLTKLRAKSDDPSVAAACC